MTDDRTDDRSYKIFAVSINTHERRPMDTVKGEANAEAYIKMAIIRRGVEKEFYIKELVS